MKRKELISILLSTITAINLYGCTLMKDEDSQVLIDEYGNVTSLMTIDGNEYIKEGNEYMKVEPTPEPTPVPTPEPTPVPTPKPTPEPDVIEDAEPLYFEPGTRNVSEFVQNKLPYRSNSNSYVYDTYETFESPEGYELLTEYLVAEWKNSIEKVYFIRRVWVNVETIKVEGTHNVTKDTYEYETFGSVVKDETLKLD